MAESAHVLTEAEVRTTMLKDADDRLRAELKRAKPGLDPKVVDGMARESLVKKIVKLRLQLGVTTAIKGPVLEVGQQIQIGAGSPEAVDPIAIMIAFMQQMQKEAAEDCRIATEKEERRIAAEKENRRIAVMKKNRTIAAEKEERRLAAKAVADKEERLMKLTADAEKARLAVEECRMAAE